MTKTVAASPPLTPEGCRARAGGRAAQGYGAAPPASRLLRIADATALRAGLDPGDLCGPSGRKYGQAPSLPRPRRGTPDDPLPQGPMTGPRGLTRGDSSCTIDTRTRCGITRSSP